MVIERSNDKINECLKLRYKVFVDEQSVPFDMEADEYDNPESECDHFLMYENGEPVGTFRCIYDAQDVIHLQRLCLLKEVRGKHFGNRALEFVESYYKNKGVHTIELNAQCYAIGFYEKNGFKVVSDVFDDAGIPHRAMKKEIG